MGATWIVIFTVAAGVTLFTTPLLRRLALRVDLVDHPAARKSHLVATPYLGGVAIAAGILTGLAVAPGLGFHAGVIGLSATVVGVVGLIDDDRQLGASSRLAVEMVAALAALAVGLRLEVTGVRAVDSALTVLWIVGLTNAANLLDNMDGLAAGVAASMAATTFLLSALGGQDRTASLALAVGGACLGFLVYNAPPARVFMGDAGSLFLGYLMGVMTLAATRPPAAPASFAVPLMLAIVPIADTTTVVFARRRRGRSVAVGGKDHLSHRLVRRGLSPGTAVAALVAVSLAVGMVGAVAGHGDLPIPLAVATSALLVGLLLAVALPAKVYEEPVIILSRRARLAVAGVFAGSVTVVGVACTQSDVVGKVVASVCASAGGNRVVAAATDGARVQPPEWSRTASLTLLAAGVGLLGVVLGSVVRERWLRGDRGCGWQR